MHRNGLRLLRDLWDVARIASRMLVEHVATVWLLGLSPLLARLASAEPARGYAWIPNDLYLVVMVTGGTLAMEAFKDRTSRGPIRSLAGVIGFCAVPAGAWAYGALEAGTTPVEPFLKSAVYAIVTSLMGIDLIYRTPKIVGDAMQEHAERSAGSPWPTEY